MQEPDNQIILDSIRLQDYPEKNYDKDVQKISRLVQKFGTTGIIVNRLDYFGNGVAVGAFCDAISFILYGFYRCKVYRGPQNLSFLYGIVLIFGGIGQVTAGFFEYLKARAFSSAFYLLLGFYCISFYIGKMLQPMGLNYYFDKEDLSNNLPMFDGDKDSWTYFYVTWIFLMAPLIVASLKVNLFFVLQSGTLFVFFLLQCIEEKKHKDGLQITSGVFEVISGFISLYIFCYQLINEQFRKCLLPCVPLLLDNEIDLTPEIEGINPQQ